MALLFGRIRGRRALAWLKHRRWFFSHNNAPELTGHFVTEDDSAFFQTEDASAEFILEAGA